MVLPPADTDTATWLKYNAALSRMDGDARLRTALDLSEGVREIRLAGLRARNPDLAHAELVARVVAEDYGVQLPALK